MLARSLIVLALFALSGCKPGSDLNTPCTLVKLDPSDGGILSIHESEIKIGASKDFISFGSTECEDFVCVRDSNFQRDPDPAAVALGYCSKNCQPGSDCPSASADDDNKADRKLTCRPLLLDPKTISAICTATPDAVFCSVTSPDFCVRGGAAADAGS